MPNRISPPKKNKNYAARENRPHVQYRPRARRRKNSIYMWMLTISSVGIVTMIITITMAVLLFSPSEEIVQGAAPPIMFLPEPSPRPSLVPPPVVEYTPEPTPDPMEGMVLSPLTGLPVPEETATLRPMAVVINNHSRALPQSGISEAEIIYEVLAEGNITRLVAIFHQLNAPKIGPVRSTRDYFADFALENDAVFVHHGGSVSGYARLRNFGIDRMDGMALEGVTFWRDPERRRIPAMLEHSSYTGATELEETMANRNIRRELSENSARLAFEFNHDNIIPFAALARSTGGNFRHAPEVTVPFSQGYPRRFVFDPQTNMYLVYNSGGPHIDENIEDPDYAQVRVSNVLIQNVRMRVIDGEGRRDVGTVGSGTGYLATMGGNVNVRWERASHTAPTRWYFANGTPMIISPGHTWINLLQDSIAVIVTEHTEV